MTTVAGDSLVFRPYSESDVNFIRSSWSHSYYKGRKAHLVVSPADFHNFHRPLIDRFFTKPTATVVIVHDESEPSIILGWIAVEIISTHLIIHYLYIKSTFKKLGLRDMLIAKVNNLNKPVIYTHLTEHAKRILHQSYTDQTGKKITELKPKYKKFNYIPHLI